MNNTKDKLIVLRDIIVAYVSKNHVPVSEVEALIRNVYTGLTEQIQIQSVEKNGASTSKNNSKFVLGPIESSVKPDGIVSLIDGRTYKTLKRHLKAHGFTPESYRQTFGLHENYPMIAPNYAAQRSAIARRTGLGRPGFMAGPASAAYYEASQADRDPVKDKQ